MKTVKIYNRKDNVVIIEIKHPHGVVGEAKQTFRFPNNEEGRKESLERLKSLLAKGYKLIK